MKEFAEYLIKNMVDYPDKVKMTEIEGNQMLILELSVDKSDIGKIVGKKGKNISAIRTILQSVASRMSMRVILELLEPCEEPSEEKTEVQETLILND